MSVERLAAALEPYWTAEAEICRAYFRSPDRTLDSDLLFLRRQAAKELFDGVEVFDGAQREEEAAHLASFTAAYDRLRRPHDPVLDRDQLARDVAWPANAALAELRRRHRAEAGPAGEVACRATEGGHGVLFAEGAALAGGGGADDVIAEACAAVHADEVRHAHIQATDDVDWDVVIALAVEQSEQRVHMRSEQFGAIS